MQSLLISFFIINITNILKNVKTHYIILNPLASQYKLSLT